MHLWLKAFRYLVFIWCCGPYKLVYFSFFVYLSILWMQVSQLKQTLLTLDKNYAAQGEKETGKISVMSYLRRNFLILSLSLRSNLIRSMLKLTERWIMYFLGKKMPYGLENCRFLVKIDVHNTRRSSYIIHLYLLGDCMLPMLCYFTP